MLFQHLYVLFAQISKGYKCCFNYPNLTNTAVARTLFGGGGVCIFIYSGSARLVSFEIKLIISKEISRVEPEYMNIHPPPPQLAF